MGGAVFKGGSFTRGDDAFRTSTSGLVMVGGRGDSRLGAAEVVRERVNVTGEGEGGLEEDGEEEDPEALRRTCSG